MLVALCTFAGYVAALVIHWSNIDRTEECLRRQFGDAVIVVMFAACWGLITAVVAPDQLGGQRIDKILNSFTASLAYTLLAANTVRGLYRFTARRLAARGLWFIAN